MIIIGFTAPLIAPHDHQKINLLARLLPPVWMEGGNTSYFLGTDDLGRDNLSRLYYSIRMSLLVAILGTLICAVIGSSIGFAAAHFRGIVDEIVMMLVDFQASLPYMILALAVIAFFENNIFLFIGVMGMYGWEMYARFARGLALAARGAGIRCGGKNLRRISCQDIPAPYSAKRWQHPAGQYDIELSQVNHAGNIFKFPGPWYPAAEYKSRQSGRFWQRSYPDSMVACSRTCDYHFFNNAFNEYTGRLDQG